MDRFPIQAVVKPEAARSHEEATLERLRRDPELAAEYLDAILQDGDEGALLYALQQVAKAYGGVGLIAERANLNAKTLYRTLSQQGNPEMKTLVAVLKSMGLRLSVRRLDEECSVPRQGEQR
jgi:probable addiction module antidote protein